MKKLTSNPIITALFISAIISFVCFIFSQHAASGLYDEKFKTTEDKFQTIIKRLDTIDGRLFEIVKGICR